MLISEGKKNEAIKRYREITGAGLKEANNNKRGSEGK
jgi:ribosomal protein L7/L12